MSPCGRRALGVLGLLVAAASEAAPSVPESVCEEEAAPPSVLLLQTHLQHPQLRPAGSGAPEDAKHEVLLKQGPGAAPSDDVLAPAIQTPPASTGNATAVVGDPSLGEAFVFLFEWSWDDVALECEEWLGPKGFAAVLVSPPNEHAQGPGWDARYKPVSYNLTSRSGNESQFVSMVQRCRSVGVAVYFDAVFNQQAPYSGVGIAGSTFGYRNYPLYAPEDFHHPPGDAATNCGVQNYDDKDNVWYCDLMGMPDLCTGCVHVQETVAAYINRLGQLGVAGFRIDAAKHINPDEIKGILSRVNSSLFHFQEVTAVPGEAVQTPMYYEDGPVTEFGFAATLGPKFIHDGQLRDDLATFGAGWGLMASSQAVVFLDNHDSQRNGQAPLTYKDRDLYTLASVFMLAYPYGYPKLMSSYYFDNTTAGPPGTPVHGHQGLLECGPGEGWVCEHRWAPITNMVQFRRMAGSAPLAHFVSGGDTLAFCRGSVGCVALNRAENEAWEVTLTTSMPPGDYCDIFFSAEAGDCPRVTVGTDGTMRVTVKPRSGVAIYIGAKRSSNQVEEDLEDSEPLD